MPIEVRCSCGEVFAAPDADEGKALKCMACGSVVEIPRRSGEPALAAEGSRKGSWQGRMESVRQRAQKIGSEVVGEASSGFSAAKEYGQAVLAMRERQKRKGGLEGEKQNLHERLGDAAEREGLGAALPSYRAVESGRKAISEAEGILAETSAALQTAQSALEAEQTRWSTITDDLKVEFQPLAASHKSTSAAVKELKTRAKKAHSDLKSLEHKKTTGAQGGKPAQAVEDIDGLIQEAQAILTVVQAELPAAQEKTEAARKRAEAKALEGKQAQQEWREEKARLDEAVQSAQKRCRDAQKRLQEAQAAVRKPLRALGKALLESGDAAQSPDCGQLIDRIKAIDEETTNLDQEIDGLRRRADQKKGGAKRFAVIFGSAALGVLLIVFVGFGIFLLNGIGAEHRRDFEKQVRQAVALASSNEQMAADMLFEAMESDGNRYDLNVKQLGDIAMTLSGDERQILGRLSAATRDQIASAREKYEQKQEEWYRERREKDGETKVLSRDSQGEEARGAGGRVGAKRAGGEAARSSSQIDAMNRLVLDKTRAARQKMIEKNSSDPLWDTYSENLKRSLSDTSVLDDEIERLEGELR